MVFLLEKISSSVVRVVFSGTIWLISTNFVTSITVVKEFYSQTYFSRNARNYYKFEFLTLK